MSCWRHSLLALAALAIGALLAGCESWSSEAKVDPNVVPWVQNHEPDPLTGGGQLSQPPVGLQTPDSPGNGLR